MKKLIIELPFSGFYGSFHEYHIDNTIEYLSNDCSDDSLSAEQVDILKDQYAIYLLRSGRMCAAGLNLKNIDYVADSIAEVIKATA